MTKRTDKTRRTKTPSEGRGAARKARGGERKGVTVSPSFFESLRAPAGGDPALASDRRRIGVLVSLAVVLLVGHVWVRLRVQDLGYENETISRLVQRLDREHDELDDAVNRDSTADVLKERSYELGLRMPEPGQLRPVRVATPSAASGVPVKLAEANVAQP